MSNVSFDSPFYPYERIETGFNTLRGAEEIPYKLIMYLLDLPDKNGYVPADDNERPRVRLAKYLWYDEDNPLSRTLPTPQQKLSMLFSGNNATLSTEEEKEKHPKGYRIMAQQYIGQAETDTGVVLKCFMGRSIARTDFKTILGIRFEIAVSCDVENISKTKVYSRIYAIYQCIIEALHGINISGIGTIYYSKEIHGDCGCTVYHDDGKHVGADVFLAIEWQEQSPFENNITIY